MKDQYVGDLRDIVDVQVCDDFILECEMDNGEIYRYDMSFVLKRDGEIFIPLHDINVFKEVWIEYGAIEWPSGLGIHGDTVVREGKLISKSAA